LSVLGGCSEVGWVGVGHWGSSDGGSGAGRGEIIVFTKSLCLSTTLTLTPRADFFLCVIIFFFILVFMFLL